MPGAGIPGRVKVGDPDDFAAVVAGLAKLRSRSITGSRYPRRSAMVCLNCATSASLMPVCCGFS